MTVDILISKMTFAATNLLVLVYHGFMRPIFVQDLQLISPVPLDLMLMSFKTLQRR
jgi:DNA phosphorothioation-dependent restriction protein DptG